MRLYHSAVSGLLTLQIKSADFKGKLNEFLAKIYFSLRELNIIHHLIYCHRAALRGVKQQKRLRGGRES